MLMSFIEAATMMSRSARSKSFEEGLMHSLPSMRATRTSEIGPLNGMSETAIAADAARPASESGMTFSSAENNVMLTNVSAW